MEPINPRPPVKPRPPVPLPPRRLDFSELPHDGQNEMDFIMRERINKWLSWTVIRSRTVSTALVGILALVLKFFGIDYDLGAVIDAANGIQLSDVVAAITGYLVIHFRINLKTDLTTPGVGGAPSNKQG